MARNDTLQPTRRDDGIAADCARRQVLGPGCLIRHRSNQRSEHAHRDPGLVAWSVCSRTSTRARWISRGRSARPISRSPSSASISRAGYRYLMAQRRARCPTRVGIAMFANEAEGRLEAVLHNAAPGNSGRSMTSCKTCPGWRRRPSQSCRHGTCSAHWAAPPGSTPGATALSVRGASPCPTPPAAANSSRWRRSVPVLGYAERRLRCPVSQGCTHDARPASSSAMILFVISS